MDNNSFLSAIFGEALSHECPLIVSFAGNPTTISPKKWFGRPWTADSSTVVFVAEENNYFSLARFKPDDAGQYRRRKAHFQGLYAVMLDDIGTKVEMERLTLPPSWLICTKTTRPI